MKPRPLRQIATLAALLAAGALASCSESGRANAPAQRTHVVRSAPLIVSFEEPGVFEAAREVPIVAPLEGKLLYVADSGTNASAGDVVAIIEAEQSLKTLEKEIQRLEQLRKDYEKAVEQLAMDIRSAALEVDTAMGELDYQRLRLADTNRELSRLQLLREAEVVPEEDVRDARSKSTAATLDTRIRDGGFSQQKTSAAISEAKTLSQIDRTLLDASRSSEQVARRTEELRGAQIKAPTTGIFQRRMDYNWQRRARVEVQNGDQIYQTQVIGTIAEASAPILKTQIAESQFQRISVGTEVVVLVDSLGGRELKGRVATVGTVAVERETTPAGSLGTNQTFSGERVFEAVVHLEGDAGNIRPGLSARVRFLAESHGAGVNVPLASIWTRQDAHYVAVKSPRGWDARKVDLGAHNDSEVRVLSGLQDGDTILATDPRAVLNQGMAGS